MKQLFASFSIMSVKCFRTTDDNNDILRKVYCKVVYIHTLH